MNMESPITYIILLAFALLIVFGVMTCNNSIADADLKKISSNAKEEYKSYNSESWSDRIVGGDPRKKAVYATYTLIAKENHTTVYDAVRNTRGKFAGQFKATFRSFSTFINLPSIRNVTRTDIMGKPAVVVHYTWENCNDDHCYTEHDEVTIPEINIPEPEYDDFYESEPNVSVETVEIEHE